VIATLWNVDDEASALLMERFYTYLRAGYDKAEALRQAQLDVRRQYPNPYYWSGFVLSGDRGNATRAFPWFWIGLGSAAALVVLLAGAVLIQRRGSIAYSTLHTHPVAYDQR
jgi:hypothetical protein